MQLLVAIEEMSELIQKIVHSKRKDRNVTYTDIASEIADVKIMLEQVTCIFSCYDLVQKQMKIKLNRLEKRLSNEAK